MSSETPAPDLSTLIGLFYPEAGEFGDVAQVAPDSMPDVYRKLLAHEHHMTVTVESHYGELVDVQVLESMHVGQYYSRKILLTKQSGRILIDRNVLRRVELSELWKVAAGQDLAELFRIEIGSEIWGRTGWIHCNGEPAIELLEVVAPAS